MCALTVLGLLLGKCQLFEAQDKCDQKVQHTLQGRNFLVEAQLFEDGTGRTHSAEWLLTLVFEDLS